MGEVDWSMLPCDLLGEIALKLHCFEDFVYFSAVCSSWHSAYSMFKNMWVAKVPWLLLPENTEDNPKCLRKLFSPNTQRCYQLELPETFGAKCWGASSGWIVTIDLTLELYMLNPLTGVRIRLPPQPTMPFKFMTIKVDNHWIRQRYMDKAYVFNLNKDDFVAVVLHGPLLHLQIAYARPGDEAWTLVKTPPKSCVHDILCMGSKLLVVFLDGMVGYCDISIFQKSQSSKVISKFLPKLPLPNLLQADYFWRRFYLLEAFGHLIVVFRNKEWEPSCYYTKGFDVYSFNLDTSKWKIVDGLGDVSLFVGHNCSLVVDGCANKNLKSNCIYFSDDETMLWTAPKLRGGNDIGIYHLGNKEFEPLYQTYIDSLLCPAFWFVPSYSC